MATPGPSTPDSTPRKAGVGVGRSFTTPTRTRGASTHNSTSTAAIGEAAGIETLYTHANSKVVKFHCASPSRPSSSSGGPHPGSAQGSLPWATLTEQTLASGPLEIYRVPGSVSFLHSGSLLHAILPRSNCWCVDGVSKFAMRVLTDTYYRIELPGETEEELAQVEEFKATLQKVLFYERTACPFSRTFEVRLPEEQVKKKKRRNTTHGPAKKWRQDRAYSWRPEDGGDPPSSSTSEADSGSFSEEDAGDAAGAEEEVGGVSATLQAETEDVVREMRAMTPSRPSVRDRVKGLTMRSVTAPPQIPLHSTTPSRLRTSVMAGNDRSELRTLQAIPTDMPPSPPDSSAGFEYQDHITPNDGAVNRSGSPLHNPRLRQRREESSSSPNIRPEPDLRADSDWQAGQVRIADDVPMHARPPIGDRFVTVDNNVESPAEPAHFVPQISDPTLHVADADAEGNGEPLDHFASLPAIPHVSDATPVLRNQTFQPATAPHVSIAPDTDPDPFAQIQARIQARRSIGGTTTSGFVPCIRQTSTSTHGASPPNRRNSNTTTSTRTLSHKSSGISRQSSQQQQYLATALVKKACAVFLGPPAHLVVLMLRIAARFAKGVFPSSLLYESPRGERRRVPGSYILESDDDYGISDDDEPVGEDELEDDFGVPIDSPVRLSSVLGLRERVRWDEG